jgi:hypothetical protein
MRKTRQTAKKVRERSKKTMTNKKLPPSAASVMLPPSMDKVLEALASMGEEEYDHTAWMTSPYGETVQTGYDIILEALMNLKGMTADDHSMAIVHAALHVLEEQVLNVIDLHEFMWHKTKGGELR